MNDVERREFGSGFERVFIGLASIATAGFLIELAVRGPLFLGTLRYKTAAGVAAQVIGQDAVNVFLMAPLLIAGGIALWLRKPAAKHLLIASPLYLMYFVFGYTIGLEWSAPAYSGNSQNAFFEFLFILIAALLILFYALSLFPKDARPRFKRSGLIAYSIVLSLFLLVFAAMWSKEIVEVIGTGTARGYDASPTAFWLVRVIDLGFNIPLGFLSVYLMWARPAKAYPVLSLFYGFFFTQIIAVNAMGWMMFLKKDPAFLWRDMIVFGILALIIAFGYIFVRRGYRTD